MREENQDVVRTELDLASIIVMLQDVLRKGYLVLAAALVAGMLGYVAADALYTPQYKTSATFVVSTAGTSTTTYQNLTTASNLASTFTEVVNSSLLRKLVLAEAGVGGFDGTINAAVVPETNLLTLTVTGSDPRTVFIVAREIIENHELVSYQVLGNAILEVLQSPAVPARPYNSSDALGTALKLAALAAAAVCAALGAISLLANKVRSKEEADRKLSCRVLGELPHERKVRKAADVLDRRRGILITSPLTGFLYSEAVGKLASRVEKRCHTGEKVIMVSSLMENEGKSTIAVNLALSLARKGRRVLLIDCDLRKPACALLLNLPKSNPGASEVLTGAAELFACVKTVPGTGLDVLAGRKSVRTAVNLVASPAMQTLLQQAVQRYDLVVVDTPPMALAPDAECIAAAADACLLVVRQNIADADALNDAIAALEKTRVHMLGCVVNNVYGATGFAPALQGRYGYGRYGYGSRYGYGRYGYGRYGYGHYANSKKRAAEEGRDAT